MSHPLHLRHLSAALAFLFLVSFIHGVLISYNSFPCTFIRTMQFKHSGILGARSLRSREGVYIQHLLNGSHLLAAAAHKFCGFFVLAWQSSTAVKSAQPRELADGMDGLRLALAFALFILFADG